MTRTLEQRAREISKYFDWDIPSEQYSTVLTALQETRDEALEDAANMAGAWVLPDGDHCTELSTEIRALKSQGKP